MANKPLLNESFNADPWTPETPPEDGAGLWHTSREKGTTSTTNAQSGGFDNDFSSKEASFPVHLKPCPDVPPPIDLDKGLERMENKLLRIQKGKSPNKLSSQDILSRITTSRNDTTPPYNHTISEPSSVSVSIPRRPHTPQISNLFCCWRFSGPNTESVEARYIQGEVAVRDTVPLVLGDELLEND